MATKLKLDVDALAVQSFATAEGEDGGRGTMQAHGKIPCTQLASCPCASGFWACTTSRQTVESCDYTRIGATCLC